jgi:hypothetical protein
MTRAEALQQHAARITAEAPPSRRGWRRGVVCRDGRWFESLTLAAKAEQCSVAAIHKRISEWRGWTYDDTMKPQQGV